MAKMVSKDQMREKYKIKYVKWTQFINTKKEMS